MNKYLLSTVLILGVTLARTPAQGTFIFDQQDSTAEGPLAYGSFNSIQSFTPPWGQSFTPAFSGIDFIRLELVDGNENDGLGAQVFINLMSGSISGPIIGTTATVAMANAFTGPVTFLFPTRVSFSAGTQYFFEPMLASGGTWNIEASSFVYSGGNSYNNGIIYPGGNLWFREGIIAPVPEPSACALLLIAVSAVCARRRFRASGWRGMAPGSQRAGLL